jgi:hypothetical protein
VGKNHYTQADAPSLPTGKFVLARKQERLHSENIFVEQHQIANPSSWNQRFASPVRVGFLERAIEGGYRSPLAMRRSIAHETPVTIIPVA